MERFDQGDFGLLRPGRFGAEQPGAPVLGDYNTLASTSTNAFFIYTDSRNGAGCAAVDAFQHGVDGSGPATSQPAPENVCSAQFGNSDVFVSKITP